MKSKYLLIVILLVAALLRFYQLGMNPVGLHRDEAFLGYNAYSILKTGRDITGDVLPLHLSSFLYSPAGYSYASIPFLALFGLSEASVRMTSALFGTLTVGLLYIVTKHLFASSKDRERIALLASGVLAVTPWHITLSRVATENVIVTFFLLLGLSLFLTWQKTKRRIFLFFSVASMSITLGIYQAPRAFVPLFIPLIVYIYRGKRITQSITQPMIWYAILIALPLLLILRSPELSLRLSTVSLLSGGDTQLIIDRHLTEDGVHGNPVIVSRMFHNKLTGFTDRFLSQYADHLSYDFLFTDAGFPDRYRIPAAGLLPIVYLPLIGIGLWRLLRLRSRATWVILSWIALAPLGSALAFDDIPNMQRTLHIVPMITLVAGVGLHQLLRDHTRLFGLTLLLGMWGTSVYLHQYYSHQPFYNTWFRHDGYHSLVDTVNTHLADYDHAVITNKESAPTIFFLFFSDYDPALFQNETQGASFEAYDRIAFDRYAFTTEECPIRIDAQTDPDTGVITETPLGIPGVLYVNASTCDTPSHARILDTITRYDGTDVFYILDVPSTL